MSTTTTQATLPIHSSSQTSNPNNTSSTSPTNDGRKPTAETDILQDWKPNFERKQSWDPQDYKRQMVRKDMDRLSGVEERQGFTENDGVEGKERKLEKV